MMKNIDKIDQAYLDLISEDVKSSKEVVIDRGDVKLRFSSKLSQEFIETMNAFTNISAKMIRNGVVYEASFKKWKTLFDKIKSLVDSAKNSVS